MRFARLPARPAVASLVTVAVSVGVVVLITQLGVRPVTDPSPWLHLRIGEYLSEGGRFDGPDPFSQSVVRSYLPTQWLPSVAAYELYAAVGLPAIAWLRAVCLLGLFLALVLTVRRGLPGVGGVLLAGGVTLVSLPTMTERPQARPISNQLSASNTSATRSRTGIRPASRCRCRAFSPPISSALALTVRSWSMRPAIVRVVGGFKMGSVLMGSGGFVTEKGSRFSWLDTARPGA